MTNSDLAIDIFDAIENDLELEGKTMADLGAGTGMLSIAGVISGVKKSLAIEMDEATVEILKRNLTDIEMDEVEVIH
jgi:putative methylase